MAYIAATCAFGFFPRSALEVPGGASRLDRIFGLIQDCRLSVHDLSLLEPRFNMPFELGLAVAWWDLNRSGRIKPSSEHTWFVFAGKRRGIQRSLSDLLGSDPYIYSGQRKALFRELSNAFVLSPRRPAIDEMEEVFNDIRNALPGVLRRAGAKSAFTARIFEELRVMGTEAAKVYSAG